MAFGGYLKTWRGRGWSWASRGCIFRGSRRRWRRRGQHHEGLDGTFMAGGTCGLRQRRLALCFMLTSRDEHEKRWQPGLRVESGSLRTSFGVSSAPHHDSLAAMMVLRYTVFEDTLCRHSYRIGERSYLTTPSAHVIVADTASDEPVLAALAAQKLLGHSRAFSRRCTVHTVVMVVQESLGGPAAPTSPAAPTNSLIVEHVACSSRQWWPSERKGA